MQNAKFMAAVQTSTNEIVFQLAPGTESVTLARGWANPDHVWLVDIRRRKIMLTRMGEEEFTDHARSYQTSTADSPPHIRGLPLYYCIRDMQMWFWPVPAHAWEGGMSKEKDDG